MPKEREKREKKEKFEQQKRRMKKNGQDHRTILREKMAESVSSVVPITVIVMILCFVLLPIPTDSMMAFLIGAVMLIVGMALFSLGTDLAMTPIGEHVGSALSRNNKLWLTALVAFLVGMFVTMSEPDLQVLAEQVPGVPNMVMIMAVSIGVGIFLVIALFRIMFKIKMSWLLLGCYGLIFILAQFVPDTFLAVAFDSGGVTTGPMTVPFILALGVGVSAMRSDKDAGSDSFGLVALCSVGPILAVMILSLIYHPESTPYVPLELVSIPDTQSMAQMFIQAIPTYMVEVAMAVLPIVVFFIIFQIFILKLHRNEVARIISGLFYTYIGLVLFLTGVNVGFMPMGNYLGQMMGALEFNWILIPVGMVIGYFVVAAEPAVHVLAKQVYELSAGSIPKRALNLSLSIGVAASVGLSMLRILTGMPLMYLLIPGYTIAMILMKFVPPVFTSIAFDSGGVASGPMTATFLLPLAMGTCVAVGGNVATDAFGVVAMVAMTPLIAIQILGLVFSHKQKKNDAESQNDTSMVEEIIE